MSRLSPGANCGEAHVSPHPIIAGLISISVSVQDPQPDCQLAVCFAIPKRGADCAGSWTALAAQVTSKGTASDCGRRGVSGRLPLFPLLLMPMAFIAVHAQHVTRTVTDSLHHKRFFATFVVAWRPAKTSTVESSLLPTNMYLAGDVTRQLRRIRSGIESPRNISNLTPRARKKNWR